MQLNQAVFNASQIAVLSKAFDETCEALKIPPTEDHDREIIATRLVELAKGGVVDARTLKERLLREARSQL